MSRFLLPLALLTLLAPAVPAASPEGGADALPLPLPERDPVPVVTCIPEICADGALSATVLGCAPDGFGNLVCAWQMDFYGAAFSTTPGTMHALLVVPGFGGWGATCSYVTGGCSGFGSTGVQTLVVAKGTCETVKGELTVNANTLLVFDVQETHVDGFVVCA